MDGQRAGIPTQPLAGKVALVTGGGRGIGRGIALALGVAGCDVAIAWLRRRREAEETCAALVKLGVRAVAIKANIGVADDIQRLVDETVAALGPVDILIANAASGVARKVLEIDDRAWDWTFSINARSLPRLAQAVAPAMQARGWGRIVTVTSPGARRVTADYAVVGASKAALESITRYLAAELAPAGIICNCVSPGLVLTGAMDHYASTPDVAANLLQATPAGRLVTPEDVGNVVAWLCTDAAAMVVGQTIEIDGGYSLRAGL